MFLHTIQPTKGTKKNKKRVGRGNSAGQGTTAGRGYKGQLARSGNRKRIGFEGGQTPLIQRQPKFGGFKNPNRVEFEVLNLDVLEAKLDAGKYDLPTLRDMNIVCTRRPVKLLGRGELTKKFELELNAVSATALEAVEKSGGSVTLVK